MMSVIKVEIIEDELLVAESIASKLRKAGFEVVAMYDEGEAAVASIEEDAPDLILMDIHLSGAMDGIETAQQIKEKRKHIPIIYLTDHVDDATVDRAKYTQPANYLSKPFNESDLIRAIKLATHNNAQEEQVPDSTVEHEHHLLEDSVFIKNQHVAEKVRYDDILFLEADRSYCKVVTKEKEYTLSTSMNKVWGQIKNAAFVRVHRSFVVNIKNITGIEGNLLKVYGHEIQVNREFREQYFNKFRFIK